MKIEIWSDIACPYCYIGLRKLQAAVADFAHRDELEIAWHSYELDPGLPITYDGKSYSQFFADKMGTNIAMADKSLDNMVALAKESGLNFNFKYAVPANTHNALRLAKLAATIGKATEMEELLFEAYFEKCLDVSNRATLIALGVKVGLTEDSVVKLLDSEKYETAVQKDIEFGEETLNLQYIPLYLFNNKFLIQGAIASEDYLKTLHEAYADWKQNGVGTEIGGTVSGKSCSVDGVCE